MKKERRQPRHFDDQFRLSVLKDYYESGVSYGQISRKYDLFIPGWQRQMRAMTVGLIPYAGTSSPHPWHQISFVWR